MEEPDRGLPSDFEDPNDYYLLVADQIAENLQRRGVTAAEASCQAGRQVTNMLTDRAADFAQALHRDGGAYVEESAQYRAGFAERLRVHWGDALDRYETFVALAEEGGRLFAHRNLGAGREYDLLLDVLVQLNGQAVRVAREVHALLSAGFPMGALSLARTLHEIAVRVGVLAEFGKHPEHTDLAERFVLHDQVINYRDAQIYQRDAVALGFEPFDNATMAELKADHDQVLARFGAGYGGQYGWAARLPGLPNSTRPSFEDLEILVGLDHHRGLYRWSSHYVHGDAKALRIARVERGGTSAVLTNATNTMLADPGQHALRSLNRAFTSMVTTADPFAYYDYYLCGAMQVLLDQADEAFVDAEESVDAAEERFQAELAERGMRYDLGRGEVSLE